MGFGKKPTQFNPTMLLSSLCNSGKLVNLSVPGNAHLENEYKLNGTCLTKLNQH